MEKANNITKNFLFEYFPYIFETDLNDDREERLEKYYYSFAISVFDRWLSEEEADDSLDKYMWKGNYQNSCEEYKISEKKYISFFKELNKLRDIYCFEENIDNEQKSCFYKIENTKELEQICLLSIREEKLLKLCMPKLQLTILGSYDMTQIVYYKEISKLSGFHDLLQKCQLYRLSRD